MFGKVKMEFIFMLVIVLANYGLLDGCLRSEFQCSSGACIIQQWKCDGEVDCPSGNDEADCGSCGADQFQCTTTGKCIRQEWVCDGDTDCGHGDTSDEDNCVVQSCKTNEYTCGDGRCIPAHWRCDRTPDCPEGDDEDNCALASCTDAQFTCNNGMCINLAFTCDSSYDCLDGEDESSLVCSTSATGCALGQFQCGLSGLCISATWVCDGEMDCTDGSDEVLCPQGPTTLPIPTTSSSATTTTTAETTTTTTTTMTTPATSSSTTNPETVSTTTPTTTTAAAPPATATPTQSTVSTTAATTTATTVSTTAATTTATTVSQDNREPSTTQSVFCLLFPHTCVAFPPTSDTESSQATTHVRVTDMSSSTNSPSSRAASKLTQPNSPATEWPTENVSTRFRPSANVTTKPTTINLQDSTKSVTTEQSATETTPHETDKPSALLTTGTTLDITAKASSTSQYNTTQDSVAQADPDTAGITVTTRRRTTRRRTTSISASPDGKVGTSTSDILSQTSTWDTTHISKAPNDKDAHRNRLGQYPNDAIIIIAVFVPGVLIVTSLILTLYCCCWKPKRANSQASKNGTVKFTEDKVQTLDILTCDDNMVDMDEPKEGGVYAGPTANSVNNPTYDDAENDEKESTDEKGQLDML